MPDTSAGNSVWPGLVSAIKKYKYSDLNTSRSTFGKAAAKIGTGIEGSVLPLVEKSRVVIEGWLQPGAVTASDALIQWMELYSEGTSIVPTAIPAATLARFPKFKDGEVDWTPFLQICEDQDLTDVMVRQHLVGKKALARLAADSGESLYNSPLLDSLAKHRVPIPRSMWEWLARGLSRPSNLVPAVQLLLRSYSSDKAADADKWFLSYLAKNPTVQAEVIPFLLTSPGLSLRVARKLLDANLPRTPIRKGSQAEEVARLAIRLLEAAAHEIESDGRNAGTAAAVVGLFRSARVIGGQALFEPVAKAASDLPRDAVTTQVLAALTDAETDAGLSEGTLIFPAYGDELNRAVEAYLQKLTSRTQGSDSVTRAEQFERYQGRRDVIESLMPVLDGDVSQERIRDMVEAALFNVGLNSYGNPGDEVEFDFRIHRSDSAEVVPGDPVTVIQAGHRLGGHADAIVLRKALVEPSTRAPQG